ncbi:MAG: peptide chain release factor 2 [Thermodesulfovibrionales bacterium]|nr:peptide chain release factor 2 [Thermodesulfovibrionales bacterium]
MLLDEIRIIDSELQKTEVWSSHEKMRELTKRKARLQDILEPFDLINSKINYIEESLELLDEEGGEIFVNELRSEIKSLNKLIDELELKHLMTGELDRNNAILSIHPGAGGTESQDWAQILMRMYLRWADRHNFKTEILDLLQGEEAGIKDVTISITGPYAYGFLKAEAGVHRLVRISPFDANKRRHTSFAAVLVYPEIEDDITVEIKEEDLRIETFRASGAGGQHVNKVSSAVRITHIPTGIVVACQNERSQHRNKAMALKILKAKLYDRQLKEQQEKIESLVGEKKDISWGNQIRSYVLQPYRLVKDHRTGLERGDVDSVFDGDIDEFIKEYLKILNKRKVFEPAVSKKTTSSNLSN